MANRAPKKKSLHAKLPVRREVSAGGLVYRRDSNGELQFVLIRPRDSTNWALPKGHIEKDESIEAAAVREVREETGLEVGSVEPLGEVSYIFSWRDRPEASLVRIFKRVHFFTMEFVGGDSSGHDSEIDEVTWFPAEEAARRATYKDERNLIEKAIAVLANSRSDGQA